MALNRDNQQVYIPASTDVRGTAASRLGVRRPFIPPDISTGTGAALATNVEYMKLHNVTGDGNCFFNAISFLCTGTENNSALLRAKTVAKYLQLKDAFVECGEGSFYNDRLNRDTKNRHNYIGNKGVWAESRDMYVMATVLNIVILCAAISRNGNLTWMPYYPITPGYTPYRQDPQFKHTPAIYIANTGMGDNIIPVGEANHFRAVVGFRGAIPGAPAVDATRVARPIKTVRNPTMKHTNVNIFTTVFIIKH